MKNRRHRAAVFAFFAAVSGLAPSLWCSDKKAVLEELNRKYYSLKANGLTGFSCQVVPDFDSAFKEIKSDAIGRDQVLPAAKKIRFEVAVGPSGAASVSHQFSEAPPSEEIAGRLRQIAEGIEQMIGGFFETWSQLMINSPLSGASDEYQMEELHDGYRFTADEGKFHVVVSTNQALVIDSVEAKTPEFEGTVHPRFVNSKNGLVLESYQAVYKTGSNNPQELSIKVTYQEIETLSLPQTITLAMNIPQGRMEAPIAFSDCKINKK